MTKSAGKAIDAKRWFILGRVQGVGYRYFAPRAAVGPVAKLSELAGMPYRGPQWGEVHGVAEQEAAVQEYGSFGIA